MSFLKIQHAILHRPWLIHPEYAFSKLGIIEKIINGEKIAYQDDSDESSEDEKMSKVSFAVSPNGVTTFGSWRDPFEGALPGSTAVISITGPIMKYDSCGDYGTKSYAALLAKANRNSNITSILIVHDSPGGTVDGTMELSQFIKSIQKPIVSLVDGMMASADYWIGSAADEIIALNETAEIGSIGTMITFYDYTKYYESKGIQVKYVYADASKHKNETFHETLKGNEAPIKNELNKLNDMFISAVKSNRPGIKETALTGKMFLAQDALEQGLIDGIGDYGMAIQRAQELAGIKPNMHVISQKPNMKVTLTTAAHAALIALCGVSPAAGQSSVEVELDAVNAAVAKQATDLKSAQDEVAGLKTKLTDAETKVSEAEAKVVTAEGKATKAEADLAALKESNPGATGAEQKGDDKIDTGKDADYWTDEDRAVYAKRKELLGK